MMGEVDADGEDESASPPPSPPYPKPGNGLMSRLKNDDEDLEWLVGSKEETAFSHMVFEGPNADASIGPNGAQEGDGMMGGVGGMI